MAEYSEVFVAFDVAKRKHAVAIAEGGRTGEVRFLGEIENSAATIERVIKRLAGRYDHATREYRRSAMIASPAATASPSSGPTEPRPPDPAGPRPAHR